jgi:excisionase family DNA binding protein
MLTPKTAAERLGVSISLIYQLCSEGTLQCFRIGRKDRRGKVLIDEQDLQAYVEQCRFRPAAAPVTTLRHIAMPPVRTVR